MALLWALLLGGVGLARADGPDPDAPCASLAPPPAQLQVAWVSPVRQRARGGAALSVVRVADLRTFVQAQGADQARTLQALGLVGSRGKVRKRYKVTLFDVSADQLCRPVEHTPEGDDADGFNGLADSVFVDDVGDGMVIDAGGSGGRNVYLIRAALDGVCALYNDENIMMSEMYKVEGRDGSDNPYSKYVIDIDAWLGLQTGSQYNVARIYNLDGTSGNTLTDDLIAQAVALAPVDQPFTHIICDRTTRLELQQSRTAVSAVAAGSGGTPAYAPVPVASNALPLVVTDQIAASNTLATTTTT